MEEFKFQSKFEPLQAIWQSLPKAVQEDNWRFWLQNQWPSSWGSAPAQLGLVGLASTNTGHFLVCCSCCRLLPARLRGKCYHSCDIDSVWKSTEGLMLSKIQAVMKNFCFSCENEFFWWNWLNVVADQSRAHSLAQSLHNSWVSE